MRNRLILLCMSMVALLGVTTAYAADFYHHDVGNTAIADKAPYYGNWWWGHRSGNRVVWEIHDYWSNDSATRLRNAGDFRFEVEAFDPSGPSSCDYLNVASVHTYELPVTGYGIYNDCGDEASKELVHLYLLETSIQGSKWYRHWTYYYKVNNPSNGGQVNYSFTKDSIVNDDLWLGKLNYDNSWGATSTDRAGLLNHY